MDLSQKGVWDLTYDEIDYVFNHRHMNNYVYAALKSFYFSPIPSGYHVASKKTMVPDYMRSSFEQFSNLKRRNSNQLIQ